MILFKTIRWQNLLSTGNVFTEVKLDSCRTSLIIGTNGSGKSTILDALSFVLYNKPFRKVNKGQLINSITGKNLLVEVEFEKGGSQWLVRRGSKPNIFEIYRDGTLVDQNAEAKDYQAYLETILGMNQKVFSQVVILGAASFIPFMQLTVPARREVIEDLLDIQVFTDMNVILKALVSKNNQSFNEANQNVHVIKTKIEMTEEFNRKQMKGNEEQITIKKTKIDELTKVALETIEKVEVETAKMATIDSSEVQKLNQEKRQFEDAITVLKQDSKASEKITSFLSEHNNCPTCKQNIDADFKASQIDTHIMHMKGLAEDSNVYRQKIADIDIRLNEIFEVEKSINKSRALITEYNREVAWYQQQVETLVTEIDDLTKEAPLVDIEPFQLDLQDKLNQLEAVKEKTKVMDAAVMLLKDGGIKSVIIKQYIPVINSLINKYLSSMDFFVDFQINEAFEETIKSRFRDEFSYESFSEGEKMRIDLAVLFAWRAVAKMRNSAATNLLMFDEVLDSSLDQYGIDEFIKIIMSLTDQENIFIISHRGDSIGDKFDNVLRFQKIRGYSQLAA